MPGVERVVAELTLGPPPDAESLRALCRVHEVSEEDSAALVETLPRLCVYRELVRGNLQEALRLSLPRTIARLGTRFEEYFDRFLAERAPRTHYLRDVTPELLDYCAPLWEGDPHVPAYLLELAQHEALHIQVSAMPTPPLGHVAAGLALDQGVTLSAALRLVYYRNAVHELPEDEADRTAPTARAVSLLVYRSPEHDVRYLELSPLARGILERLLGGEALGAAVQGAATAEGAALTETVLSGAAQLLADLAERGVVWGPAAKGPSFRPHL
ncbi:MAG: uncharacterized protein K0R38_934 [Polyangiaceae bacterium]|jgi:hypothetical protein|nr:uncharacterized protein [Polyangiaceae bacterium]